MWIENIDYYLNLIAGNDSFIVKRDEEFDYGVINYIVNTPMTFPNIDVNDENTRIIRNCRGLKFRLSDGKILNLAHEKWFNIGERDETSIDKIIPTDNTFILEKLDGSMCHPSLLGNNIRWMTKMGITDASKNIESFANQYQKYEKMARVLLESNYTPIFEWVSPTSLIVVEYDHSDLILTDIRHNFSGISMSREQQESICAEFSINIVKLLPIDINSIQTLCDEISKIEGEEGIILIIGNQKYKIKTNWYRERHRINSKVMTEKDVIQLILDEEIDDVIANLTGTTKEKISNYTQAFYDGIFHTVNEIYKIILDGRKSGLSKKDAAMKESILSIQYYPTILNLWNTPEDDIKQKAFKNIVRYLKMKYHNKVRLSENTIYFNHVKFNDYCSGIFFNCSN